MNALPFRLAILTLALALGGPPTFALNPLPPTQPIAHSLDIAPVWSGHPVSFALLTQGSRQFVAYYDAARVLTVATRRLTDTTWTTVKLPVVTGWDSHNYIALAADRDGQLHLSANMHVNPLVYFRTKTAGATSAPSNASTA